MPRTSASRSRMLPTDRQAQILAAARRILEHKPIDEVSVDAVAAEAGVSPGLLFHYFGSQRKFRHAVLTMAAEELLSHVRPDPALSLAEQLNAGVVTFIDYVTRFPTIYRAVVSLGRGSDVKTLHSSVRGTIADWILDGIEQVGVEVTGPLRLTVAGWLAYMEEVVLGWIANPLCTKEELTDMCERSFYDLAGGAIGDEERWARIRELMVVRP
ncbi:TetR/AcrR family transcriptional regulator [Streptomyces sp. NA04227]|uniref:TetR/AcrR family transcriptional regulator n=1 Tax=Streptomyces sp. NA04227 TaxID=2742136 RepID=UPI00159296F1|nr:TetR/AcrR family transcriptional regulator [Streptomyces sp. NA04227]QKW06556.1 TetR/AcrR family transcriptional regulator [Streptomyces sp. NA04227]